jgi:2-polyprenyl-3-methyl-5-hydroxy-6-metoxy-1,4-benzoquinol methylase
MISQNKYYSEFAMKYREEIISSADPSLWTTDILRNGPISARMKLRITTLKSIVNDHFSREYRIFDIGCGFGRQAFMLAREGFKILGTDTNKDFIVIAREIFRRHSLEGDFYCTGPGESLSDEKFKQVVLLEVLEHIRSARRKKFISSIKAICTPDSKIIISIPRVKPGFKPKLLNFSKYFLSPFIKKDEHPYPIPGEKAIKRILGKNFVIIKSIIHNETAFYICKS